MLKQKFNTEVNRVMIYECSFNVNVSSGESRTGTESFPTASRVVLYLEQHYAIFDLAPYRHMRPYMSFNNKWWRRIDETMTTSFLVFDS